MRDMLTACSCISALSAAMPRWFATLHRPIHEAARCVKTCSTGVCCLQRKTSQTHIGDACRRKGTQVGEHPAAGAPSCEGAPPPLPRHRKLPFGQTLPLYTRNPPVKLAGHGTVLKAYMITPQWTEVAGRRMTGPACLR